MSSRFNSIIALLSEHIVECQVEAVDGLMAALSDPDVQSRSGDAEQIAEAFKAQLRAERGRAAPDRATLATIPPRMAIDEPSSHDTASVTPVVPSAVAPTVKPVTLTVPVAPRMQEIVSILPLLDLMHQASSSRVAATVAPPTPAEMPVAVAKRPPSANNWYLKMRMIIVKQAFPGQSSRYMKLAMEGWNKDTFGSFDAENRPRIVADNPTADSTEIMRLVVQAFVLTVPVPEDAAAEEVAVGAEGAEGEHAGAAV